MPFVIYVLGLGFFAQGTSEFMLSGVLPSVAHDLDVPLSSAGQLVSAFAIGMFTGAPLLGLATLKMPRRAALIGFQLVFIAAHVAAALVPNFGFLLVMRVVSAMAYAGFWAVASVAAISLVAPTKRGRAISVVVSGLSVATIIGVPAGTLPAQHAGWRAAFWAVSLITALSAVALLFVLPGGRDTTSAQPHLGTELRSPRVPRLWVAYATTALSVAANFAIFAYLRALLEDVTGISDGLIPVHRRRPRSLRSRHQHRTRTGGHSLDRRSLRRHRHSQHSAGPPPHPAPPDLHTRSRTAHGHPQPTAGRCRHPLTPHSSQGMCLTRRL
ncbi:MFS transporter [Streptomyces sp. NBC_01764]|uniref:MFS transporter n=1 Tax=Streptomyces sp. NBC_01764 TaxID=2975935 RepID=UPI00224DC77A|nr:MFS transporter [Streptomyces sp. NBC_01764]MCX4403064.1 MFS transporter [Streptomyces sp. NBC_01764]